jgi:hypothetical protein
MWSVAVKKTDQISLFGIFMYLVWLVSFFYILSFGIAPGTLQLGFLTTTASGLFWYWIWSDYSHLVRNITSCSTYHVIAGWITVFSHVDLA